MISIHASTREATKGIVLDINLVVISIHASTREATIAVRPAIHNQRNFNPRLYARGDH